MSTEHSTRSGAHSWTTAREPTPEADHDQMGEPQSFQPCAHPQARNEALSQLDVRGCNRARSSPSFRENAKQGKAGLEPYRLQRDLMGCAHALAKRRESTDARRTHAPKPTANWAVPRRTQEKMPRCGRTVASHSCMTQGRYRPVCHSAYRRSQVSRHSGASRQITERLLKNKTYRHTRSLRVAQEPDSLKTESMTVTAWTY